MRLESRTIARVLLLYLATPVLASAPLMAGHGTAVPNGPEHAGSQVEADLPSPLRVKNVGSRVDGAGLCVWASIEMASRYHNVPSLIGIFDAMKDEPGGGWPGRVEKEMLKRGLENHYRQFYGPISEGLPFVRQALAEGRMVCATYGYGEFYKMQTIAHMVCIVQDDAKQVAVLDNNDPEHIWWMDEAEYGKRAAHPSGDMWALYLLAPPPPPAPHN